MARPRKLGTEEMLDIVNKYYEGCGDPSRLKCSCLEEYATSAGIEAKAYDFRRNEAVRQRMEELRGISQLDPGTGAIAYKTLDIDALLKRCNTKTMLRDSLQELDGQWRRPYDRAAELLKSNEAWQLKLAKNDVERKKLNADVSGFSERVAQVNKANNDLLAENRYLKKMLRTYLYPAVANEILKQENVIEQNNAEVPRSTVEKLSDPTVPLSFSASVSADKEMLSREEALLAKMRAQALGRQGNE